MGGALALLPAVGACGYGLGLESARVLGLVLALGSAELDRRSTWRASELGRTARVRARAWGYLLPPLAFMVGAQLGRSTFELPAVASLWAPSLAGWALAQLEVAGGSAFNALIVGCWIVPALIPMARQ